MDASEAGVIIIDSDDDDDNGETRFKTGGEGGEEEGAEFFNFFCNFVQTSVKKPKNE
jgi:hypothetical protein